MDSSFSPKDEICFLCVCHHISNAVCHLHITSLRTELRPTKFGASKYQLRYEPHELKTFCVPVCNTPILNSGAGNSRYGKADSTQSDTVGLVDVTVMPRVTDLTDQPAALHLPYPESLQFITSAYIHPG